MAVTGALFFASLLIPPLVRDRVMPNIARTDAAKRMEELFLLYSFSHFFSVSELITFLCCVSYALHCGLAQWCPDRTNTLLVDPPSHPSQFVRAPLGAHSPSGVPMEYLFPSLLHTSFSWSFSWLLSLSIPQKSLLAQPLDVYFCFVLCFCFHSPTVIGSACILPLMFLFWCLSSSSLFA